VPVILLTLLSIVYLQLYFCFATISADYLLLHSFPTRRSSDLWTRASLPVAPWNSAVTALAVSRGSCRIPRSAYCIGCGTGDCRRSEEHTSELQSRENLVCRLLLEKKK